MGAGAPANPQVLPEAAPAPAQPAQDAEANQRALDAKALQALQDAGASPATISAVRYQQQQAAEKRARIADGTDNPKPLDRYYAVKTGDTAASIAKDLNHEGEGAALLGARHPGGPS